MLMLFEQPMQHMKLERSFEGVVSWRLYVNYGVHRNCIHMETKNSIPSEAIPAQQKSAEVVHSTQMLPDH